jgi:hypothetical protein
MPLGAVFIRPQPLLIPPSRQGEDALEILSTFAESFTHDPQAALPAITIMGEELLEGLRDFVMGREERLRFADGKIRNLFNPYVEIFDTFVEGLSGDTATAVMSFLEALKKLLEHLTSEQVGEFVRKLFDIADKDMGINSSTLRTLFTDLTTRMITRMKSRVVGGDTSDEAVALYDFGVGLQEIQALVDGARLPDFDAELLVKLIETKWREAGIDPIVLVLKKILESSEDILQPLTTLAQTIININVNVSVNVNVGGNSPSLGAAAADTPAAGATGTDPIAWYASWAAGDTVRYPEESSINYDDDPINWNRFQNPYLLGVTYKHIDREKMEKIAFHTAWIFPAVEALFFHATSMERGDVLSNLNTIAFDTIDVALIGAEKGPLPWWVHWFVWPPTSVIPWGWEAGWDRLGLDAYPWVNALGDLAENAFYRRWTWLGRELFLSILTLLNNDLSEYTDRIDILRQDRGVANRYLEMAEKTRNVNQFEGVCYATSELGALLVPGILSLTDRANYGFVKKPDADGGVRDSILKMIGFGCVSLVTSAAFMYLGIFWARLLAGEWFNDGGRYGRVILKERIYGHYSFENAGQGFSAIGRGIVAILMYIVDHVLYLYLLADGNTASGTYCLDPDDEERNEFLGYPEDAENSPYMLPWDKDAGSRQCVQGNMGIWSHNPQKGSPTSDKMTYAYDFSHTLGDEALASRAGIISDIRDSGATGEKTLNYVQILHLIIFTDGTSGLPAIPLPTGATTFADGITPIPTTFKDGTTAIPPGTLFPPYWDAARTLTLGFLPPLHPSGAILPSGALTSPSYYAGFAGFAAATRFAFLDSAYDRCIAILAGSPPVITSSVPTGGGNTSPLLATYGEYQHGMFGFMQASTLPAGTPGAPDPSKGDIYRSRTINEVLGQFIKQGQVIMLADSTGNSAYNHLHVQVLAGISGSGSVTKLTIPFIFKDAEHDIAQGIRKALRSNGVPRAFTFYVSKNTRIAPE